SPYISGRDFGDLENRLTISGGILAIWKIALQFRAGFWRFGKSPYIYGRDFGDLENRLTLLFGRNFGNLENCLTFWAIWKIALLFRAGFWQFGKLPYFCCLKSKIG
ncbi:hypothetical protein QUF72_15040, partial [Desulfobacterales bacterium HSG2]|nr:hypothetical protein [Desulfobacterales bacterium HSG2]